MAPSGQYFTPSSRSPVGDAGGGEEHVVAGDEVVGRQHALDVVAAVEQGPALLVVARVQAALDRAAEALQGGGGDHALGRAADAEQQVDAAAARGGGRDGAGHVAVGDQVHGGADAAHGLDDGLVPRAVQDHDRHLLGPDALGLRDGAHVLVGRRRDVDRVGGLGADRHLLHVDGGAGEEHRVARGQRDDGERVRLAVGGEPGPVDRVDGDVDAGPLAVADLLAVEQHGRLVLLALADHDGAVHRDAVDHEPHRVDGGPVGGQLVAAADPAARGQRGGLRHADQLHREVAVGALLGAHAGSSWVGARSS